MHILKVVCMEFPICLDGPDPHMHSSVDARLGALSNMSGKLIVSLFACKELLSLQKTKYPKTVVELNPCSSAFLLMLE